MAYNLAHVFSAYIYIYAVLGLNALQTALYFHAVQKPLKKEHSRMRIIQGLTFAKRGDIFHFGLRDGLSVRKSFGRRVLFGLIGSLLLIFSLGLDRAAAFFLQRVPPC